jgi:adenosine deaminase CECR1
MEFSRLYDVIKREATDVELYQFLYAMPKAGDIHHHLGGGFLARRWFAVATDPKRNGGQRFYTRFRISPGTERMAPQRRQSPHVYFWMTLNEAEYGKLPSLLRADFKSLDALDDAERRAWISSVKLDLPGEGRDEFFEYTWSRLNNLLSSIHVCAELTVENMQLMSAEGVRYMELMTGYRGWRDEAGRDMSPADADAFWRERLAQPDARATGVLVKFKAVVLRFADNAIEQAEQHMAHIDANRDLWVGLDMAGREDDNRGYPNRFTEVFDRLLRRYPEVNISIHAGEAEKADRNIIESLRLGASRIGHGINLIQDTGTMQLMRNSQHLIEINLVSNHLLGYVPDPDLHPFPVYLRQGIPCCLNTDDRGMWDSNMTDEYFVAAKRFNLSWRELISLGRFSLQHAFISDDERRALTEDFEKRLGAFTASLTLENWRAALGGVASETYGYGSRHLGLGELARTMPHEGLI